MGQTDNTGKKIKNTGIDKKKSSLVLNYDEDKKNEVARVAEVKEPSVKKHKRNAKTPQKAVTDTKEEINDFKEQLEQLKGVKNFLTAEVSTLVNVGIALIKKINLKIFGKRKRKKAEEPVPEVTQTEEIKEEKFTFSSLINLNIVFTDNKKVPLYIQPKQNNSMYAQNEDILYAATMGKITDVLRETGMKLKKVPVPDQGTYEGIPLNEIYNNITEEEILTFLIYVKRFPSKYIGKNYRISESFAAWIMSGTPDN